MGWPWCWNGGRDNVPRKIRESTRDLAGHASAGRDDGSSRLAKGTYLLRNDVMFTAMKHTQAEFSEFFLSLRDEAQVLSATVALNAGTSLSRPL